MYISCSVLFWRFQSSNAVFNVNLSAAGGV